MRKPIVALFVLFFAPLLLGQDTAGDTAIANKDWAAAEHFFAEKTKTDSNDGRSWFQLGTALHEEGKFLDSANAFQHAFDAKYQMPRALYREAVNLARAGERDRAFATLQRLNELGFAASKALVDEPQFASLHDDPRWQATVDATIANATPCEHSPENRQFDFWIGEWDVQTTTGDHAGHSKVDRILNGCALLENWAGGGEGKSLNIYNASKKQWQQFWVDAGGEVHEYAGTLINGEMRFEGMASDHAGHRTVRRMTFTPMDGGKVRQKGEVSQDGKDWTTEYEFIYVPVKGRGTD